MKRKYGKGYYDSGNYVWCRKEPIGSRTMLSLETAMLTQFGAADAPAFQQIMTASTGAGISIIVVGNGSIYDRAVYGTDKTYQRGNYAIRYIMT